MKKLAVLGALAMAGATWAMPAAAQSDTGAPICLKTYFIDRTTVVDPKTILFRMKDGKVYRSDLRAPCMGLRFNGFEYVTHYEEVCGGAQAIRVLRTNQVCLLGRFTPQSMSHS